MWVLSLCLLPLAANPAYLLGNASFGLGIAAALACLGGLLYMTTRYAITTDKRRAHEYLALGVLFVPDGALYSASAGAIHLDSRLRLVMIILTAHVGWTLWTAKKNTSHKLALVTILVDLNLIAYMTYESKLPYLNHAPLASVTMYVLEIASAAITVLWLKAGVKRMVVVLTRITMRFPWKLHLAPHLRLVR